MRFSSDCEITTRLAESPSVSVFVVACNFDNAIVTSVDHDAASERATTANGTSDGHIFIVTEISALTINECARGADLHARTTGDTGTLAERHIGIGNDDGGGTTLFNTEREVTRHLGTGTDATSAEDTAIVIEDEIGMARVHREVRPLRLHLPVSHVFVVRGVLQFAIAAADLAERTEMIAFAEEQ